MTENLLKNKGIRNTSFRQSVLDIFLKNENAISLETIEESLGRHDRITLYRTLKTFTDKGLIHEIVLPGESKKMALCDNSCSSNDHQHQHIHFQCNSCQEVYCLPLSEEYNITPKGFTVNYFEVIASGICRHCA